MRTKTLLLSAVALAAGIVSSFAQPVFSINVVGYYNSTVPGGVNGGRLMFANQLSNSANDISIVLTNGPVSDPDGLKNTSLNIWNNNTHTYRSFLFFTDADAANNFGQGFGDGWYDGAGNIIHTNLTQNQGAFIINPRSTNITILVVGQVIEGTNTVSVKPGYNAFSIVPPIATNLTVLGFPGFSDPNGLINDSLNRWDPAIQNYRTLLYFTDADAANNFGTGFGDGWYDGAGNNAQNSINFVPHVGEAFFLIRSSTGTSNWVYSFKVQ
jgi:hypothetical protein